VIGGEIDDQAVARISCFIAPPTNPANVLWIEISKERYDVCTNSLVDQAVYGEV
jgi:hypothetical protein